MCWKAKVALTDSRQPFCVGIDEFLWPELALTVIIHIILYSTYSILFSSTASLYFSCLWSLTPAKMSYRTRRSMNVRVIMNSQISFEPK